MPFTNNNRPRNQVEESLDNLKRELFRLEIKASALRYEYRSHFQSLPYTLTDDIDRGFCDAIHSIQNSDIALTSVKNAPGNFLRRLHLEMPCEDKVRNVVHTFPRSLRNGRNPEDIPLLKVASSIESVRYVPILAQEAVKRNTFNEKCRGGLLAHQWHWGEHQIVRGRFVNALQGLAMGDLTNSNSSENDQVYLKVLKDLRRAGLLRNKDLVDYELVHGCCKNPSTVKRLEYLIQIYPPSLASIDSNGNMPIHISCCKDHIGPFDSVLTAGFKYFPQSFALLFAKNNDGDMAILRAIECYGKAEVLTLVKNQTHRNGKGGGGNPLLYYVLRNLPHHSDGFISIYHDDCDILKKCNGEESLHHVCLQEGVALSDENFKHVFLHHHLLEERESSTNLYPFMYAASIEKNDLSTVYKLLVAHPSIIGRCLNENLVDVGAD